MCVYVCVSGWDRGAGEEGEDFSTHSALFPTHFWFIFFPPIIEKVISLLNLQLTQCVFPSLLLGKTTSSLVRVYIEAFKKF